ncbi:MULTISPECIES: hypothetical protein [unclassified Sphingomonas]|uniref:hypothetical protein n=1 Tax=unclassified Sphingomonas TaxID=196159 RepID=UPI0022699C07|nr:MULTISPECIES: hypothetical protein [unclassified Sphingomonas]
MPFAPYDDEDDSSLGSAGLEVQRSQQLDGSIGRLHSFAVLHGPGEIIDDISGLMTEDLHLLLDALEKAKSRTRRP